MFGGQAEESEESGTESDGLDSVESDEAATSPRSDDSRHSDQAFLNRCRYIPMRLTPEERQLLALLEVHDIHDHHI